MTVVDLHPEDLLDKDSRRDLTSDELVRLEAHLVRCAACRAERVLRLDFAAELEADDRPSAILGLVQGALKNAEADAKAKADADARAEAEAKADSAADAEAVARVGIPGLRRRSRRTSVVLLFAAAVLVASAAGATGLTGRVWLRLRGPTDVTHEEPSAVLPSPTTLSNTSHGFSSSIPAPFAPPASALAVETPAPEPTAILAIPAMPADVLRPVAMITPPASPLRTVSFAPSPSSRSSLPVAPVALVAPFAGSAPGSASALFDAANAARRAGDMNTALGLYDNLERQFPGSREARSANATTGRLLLDHGDSSGAVARFDTYLASGAPELREEAMAGRATALERLGRDEEESRAWALLLATYPHTPYASHARARVGRSLPR